MSSCPSKVFCCCLVEYSIQKIVEVREISQEYRRWCLGQIIRYKRNLIFLKNMGLHTFKGHMFLCPRVCLSRFVIECSTNFLMIFEKGILASLRDAQRSRKKTITAKRYQKSKRCIWLKAQG